MLVLSHSIGVDIGLAFIVQQKQVRSNGLIIHLLHTQIGIHFSLIIQEALKIMLMMFMRFRH